MTYAEYRKEQLAKINSLPLFFAFSRRQLEKEMAKIGLTTSDEDKEKICRVPGVNGAFCLKSDIPKIIAYFEEDNITELMKDPVFAEEAFRYEMDNHEYAINWQGDWDVCSCFFSVEYESGKTGDDYLKESGCSDEIIKAYHRAARAHRNGTSI